MKKIIQLLSLLLLTSASFAETHLKVYSNDVGAYSFAFTPSRCVGNFDFNYSLLIPINEIDKEACRDGSCRIILYAKDNCAPDKIIATGSFNVKTGKTTFTSQISDQYILTGDNFYVGVETKRPHC